MLISIHEAMIYGNKIDLLQSSLLQSSKLNN